MNETSFKNITGRKRLNVSVCCRVHVCLLRQRWSEGVSVSLRGQSLYIWHHQVINSDLLTSLWSYCTALISFRHTHKHMPPCLNQIVHEELHDSHRTLRRNCTLDMLMCYFADVLMRWVQFLFSQLLDKVSADWCISGVKFKHHKSRTLMFVVMGCVSQTTMKATIWCQWRGFSQTRSQDTHTHLSKCTYCPNKWMCTAGLTEHWRCVYDWRHKMIMWVICRQMFSNRLTLDVHI